MEKCWYLWINGQQEGPFSYWDLKDMAEVTPDTLAWKEGFQEWLPIRKIKELKDLFKDSENLEEVDILSPKISPREESTIALDFVEPPFFLWMLFAALIFSYVIFRLYYGTRS